MGRLEATVVSILGLRQTIAKYRPNLERNEIQTRVTLIDPMLRALGWDVSNPGEVVQETGRGAGVADYALKDRNTGMPILLLESKSLNTDLGTARSQVAQYCYGEAVNSAIITDGDDWVLLDIAGDVFDDDTDDAYDDEERYVAYEDVAQFSISRGDVVTSAIRAQRFANPSSPPTSWMTEIDAALAQVRGYIDHGPADTNQQPQSLGYKTLASLNELDYPPVPRVLRFADGYVFRIEIERLSWSEVVRQVAIYLCNLREKLHHDDLPIEADRSRTRYVANDRPRHKNRREFGDEYEVCDGIFVELDHTPRSGVIAACTLLKTCGIAPHGVKVMFD